MEKAGILGLVTTLIGISLLCFTFYNAYQMFLSYSSSSTGGEFLSSLTGLIKVGVIAIFLGIMGWVGGILLLRGIDFLKVEKGVGMVTFKVEKGVEVLKKEEE